MRWPWARTPENRGTLTFLPDGQTILGLPHKRDWTQRELATLRQTLRNWETEKPKLLVLPFPLEVIDKR
jgi:hypothetical protein